VCEDVYINKIRQDLNLINFILSHNYIQKLHVYKELSFEYKSFLASCYKHVQLYKAKSSNHILEGEKLIVGGAMV
jgi:hypothetical protein